MCLINAAHEHFITKTGKKSKPALINFMGPEGGGAGGRHMGPGPEKNKYPILFLNYCKIIDRCNQKIIENNKEL